MNRTVRRGCWAALALALAGCAVGPDYHPPNTQAPPNWSEAQLGGTTNSAVQIVQWWKTFNDPELDSLIERAVKANYDLRIATAQLLQARALRNAVYWDFTPTINGSAAYKDALASKKAQTTPLAPFHTDLYDAHFDSSWEIDVFGGKRRGLQEAKAKYASVEEDRRDTLVSVLAEVARSYVEVRGFQKRLAIARSNIQAQQEAVEITQARFNAGLTSELDVKQAESLLATTQSQLPALETGLKQGIHQLSVLIGQPPGALLAELSKEAPIPTMPPTVPVGLPSELLRRRPDVRRAERQLAASTADIGVQTAELFPKFTLLATGGFQSLSAGDWFTSGARYWSAGPMISWRIFDLGRIRSQIQAANAVQQQSLATYEQTVLQSFADVEDALVAYANEQVRYRSLTAVVAADRRALELATQLYTKGLGQFLNVLDSQRSLYVSEDQLVQSERTVVENLVALYKALGGGWETESETKVTRQ